MIVTSSGIVVVVMKSIEDILGDVVFLFVFKICVDHSVKSASFQLYNSLFLGNDR